MSVASLFSMSLNDILSQCFCTDICFHYIGASLWPVDSVLFDDRTEESYLTPKLPINITTPSHWTVCLQFNVFHINIEEGGKTLFTKTGPTGLAEAMVLLFSDEWDTVFVIRFFGESKHSEFPIIPNSGGHM